jgi:hypothetical protein
LALLLLLFCVNEDLRDALAAPDLGVVPIGEIGDSGDIGDLTAAGVVDAFPESTGFAGVDVFGGAEALLATAGDWLSVVGRGLAA